MSKKTAVLESAMTWVFLHASAESLAADAALAMLEGDEPRALELYSRAALAESDALTKIDPSKVRTLAITAVSAACLYYKANLHEKAERLAHEYMGRDGLAEFARHQFRDLLRSIAAERADSDARADLCNALDDLEAAKTNFQIARVALEQASRRVAEADAGAGLASRRLHRLMYPGGACGQ